MSSAARGATTTTTTKDLGQIMPIGDSITDGFNLPPGYREDLYHLLTNNGYTFQFVGSATDRSTPTLDAAGDQHHEGHSGYVIRNLGTSPGTPYLLPFTPPGAIADSLETWLPGCGCGGSGPNPNYILLMIGTNDIAFQYFLNGPRDNGVNSVEMRLDQLITQISTPDGGLRPNAHLIVASITNTTDTGNRQNYANFAAAVPAIVAAHQARGENVSYVDMFDALNPNTDLADYLHPNAQGYAKMAQVWYDGIVAAAGAGAAPTPTAPEPDGIAVMAVAAVVSLRRPARRGDK
jgi:hypothetical protein